MRPGPASIDGAALYGWNPTGGADGLGAFERVQLGASGAVLVSAQNTSSWIWPSTLYTDGTASGLTTTDNTVVYTSADVTPYNYHLIQNISTTDPVDVYVSVDGTNYTTLAAAVLLHDDVTTGGGLKVLSIPAGKVGVLEGKYKRIRVLKMGATVETPAIRYAHMVK